MLSRRIHSIILLLALLLGGVGMNCVQAAVYNGTCGTSATWSLNTSTGVLTISGSGAMTDWSTATAVPWNTYSTYVKSATISSGITSIGRYAFSKCSNLTTATIPSSVTLIGADAFSYCSSLKSITLPSNLTTVYNGAFMGCTSLTTVTIPSKLTTLPNNMFNGCTSLKSVTLHNQLTEIGQYCFKNCSSLTSITIPSSVTKVDYYAFQSCTGLKNITFPNKVTTISQGVCMGCTALTSVTIQGSVTNINQYALYGCSSLTTFTIPTTVKQIGNCAFQGCSSLKSIAVPSGVTSIAISVFENCTSLASVTLPTTITSISNSAFKGCSSLTTLTIPANVTSIDYSVFENCTKLKSITIPNKVTAIKNNTFYNCTSLTSVTIPSSVTTISYSVFYNCTSLASISLPSSITSIGSSAFQGCAKLTSITIPSKVTKLETYTFSGCTSLTSFTIPSTITSLGTKVLGNCTSLKDITVSWTTSAAIPNWNNLTTNSGVKLHIPCGTGTIYRAKDGWKNYTIVGSTQYKLTVSANNSAYGSVKIGSGTASGSVSQNTYCEQEVQLTAVPKTGYHFTKWSGGSTATTNPLTVTMPGANTTYTANFAINTYTIAVASNNSAMGYAQMTYVDPISLNTQVYANTSHAFKHGDKLTLSATPNTGYHFVQWNDGVTTASRSVTVTAAATYTATFAINTYTLTATTNNSSYGKVKIDDGTANATVSKTVNHGASATITAVLTTSNCNIDFLQWNDGVKDNPRTVTVTAAATYTAQFGTIGGNCGANGNNLTWSFNRCTGVLTISGSGAMADYTSSPQPWASYISYINSVVLPEGITSIGIRAFKNHTALSSINLPSTLTNIGLEAFRATALTSVEIPSGMQWINYWTFKDCASLTKVRLPASITSLPTPGAFCGCTSLQFVYVSWETASQIPTCSNTSNFFHDLTTKPTLYVPCGTISLYQNKGWNNKFTITDVLLSGTCGSNLTWSLNTCGVLTIRGTGAMSNYPAINMPWKSHRASITSVVISNGVTSIGYNAFNGCSNLTSVTIPPSVTSIGQNAFYGCYAMESLYITDLAAWCNVEFGVSVEATPFMRNNYNSGSTEYLGGGNLYLNGTLVTTLTIPDGITEIKNLTFLGCSSITSIDFNQVTTIGSASFKGCHGLTSVTLPEGVTSLQNAFPYCTQLQSISIPASLTSLARQTLYHSDALTDIYVYWTDNIPGWPEYFTSKSPQSSITLHVPCGTEELYNTKAKWKNYTIEGEGTNTITVQAEDPTMGDVSIMVNP